MAKSPTVNLHSLGTDSKDRGSVNIPTSSSIKHIWQTTSISWLIAFIFCQILLTPFIFTLYTADCRHDQTPCHLQEVSDNSALIGLILNGEDPACRDEVDWFVSWCYVNYLSINIINTKELHLHLVVFIRQMLLSEAIRICVGSVSLMRRLLWPVWLVSLQLSAALLGQPN